MLAMDLFPAADCFPLGGDGDTSEHPRWNSHGTTPCTSFSVYCL